MILQTLLLFDNHLPVLLKKGPYKPPQNGFCQRKSQMIPIELGNDLGSPVRNRGNGGEIGDLVTVALHNFNAHARQMKLNFRFRMWPQ